MASKCSICVRKNLKRNSSVIGSETTLTDICNHSEQMNNNNSPRSSSHRKNSSFDSFDAYKFERPSSTCSVRSTQSEISPLIGRSRRITLSPTHSLRSFGSRPHSRNSIDSDDKPNYARTTHSHSSRVRSVMSTKYSSTGRIGSVTLSAKYGSNNGNNNSNVEYSPQPKSRLPIPTYMINTPSGERGSIKDWVAIRNSSNQGGVKFPEDSEELTPAQKLANKFRKPRKGLIANTGKKLPSQVIMESLTSVMEDEKEEKGSPEFNSEPIEIHEDLSITHSNSNFFNLEEGEIEFGEEYNNGDDGEDHQSSEAEELASSSQQFDRPISFNEFQSMQSSLISQSGNTLELLEEELKKCPSVNALVDYVDKNGGEDNEFDNEKLIEHINKINNGSNIDLSTAPQIITDLPNQEQENQNTEGQPNTRSNPNQSASRALIPSHIEAELKQNSERLEKIKEDYNQFVSDMDKLKEFFDNDSNNNKIESFAEFETELNEELIELKNSVQEKPQVTVSINENLQTLLDETAQITENIKLRIDKMENQQLEEISKPFTYHILNFLSYSFHLFLSILFILVSTVYTHSYFNRFIQLIDFTTSEAFKASTLELIQQLGNHIVFSFKTYTPKHILFTPDDNLAPLPQILLFWAIISAIKKVLNPDRYYHPQQFKADNSSKS